MSAGEVLRIALGLLPVLLFLSALWFLDTYKLVPKRRIYAAIIAGGLAALVCY